MNRSFANSGTERIFDRQGSGKVPAALQRPALRKLLMLHAATGLDDLGSPPGNRPESLKGDRKGRYSIRINDQWRIRFTWKGGHAERVEIVDRHQAARGKERRP